MTSLSQWSGGHLVDREIGRQLLLDGACRCRATVQTWPKCPCPFVLSIEMREVTGKSLLAS